MFGSKGKLFLILIVVLLISPVVGAQTVKLASPFPEGTEWDNTLKRLAAEWADITNGRVRVRIYPGGVAGDDPDVIRKMRFRQIDAAVLTTFGMKTIVPDSFVMTLPGTIQSEEELDIVLRDFAPRFDQDFIDEGFRVLSWSKTGWAYFFAGVPAPDVNGFKRETLAVSSADEELVVAFKAIGFKVVPIALNEVMVGLQSGMVDSLYAPPMAAAVFQWFAMAPYMIDFEISPVVGGLLISERTWSRIPEQYHEELKASVDAVVADFYSESVRLNEEAMNVMNRNGLEVVSLTAAQKEEWYGEMKRGIELVVGDGGWIAQNVYDEYITLLENLR